MTPDGDSWQLAHRIEEPWGQTATVWELRPLTVMRPDTGETTARFLCATCDEPVDCVVVSADTQNRLARQRRRRARVTTVIAGVTGLVLVPSGAGGLVGAVISAQQDAWGVAAGLVGIGALYGWLGVKAFSYARPWATIPPGDADVRMAAPSPLHELRPPAGRSAIPGPDRSA